MALYRDQLPQLSGGDYLTDGGLETTLVFHDGIDLPCFAAFPLVMNEDGRETLKRYFKPYLETAAQKNVGFILDTVTWRTNADWGRKLGYSAQDLADVQRQSVAFADELREAYATDRTPIVINGILGPRGDGYKADDRMSAEEAEQYHAPLVEVFRDTATDMISAMTMTYAEEAIGIVRAAQKNGMPVVISFTVETDGRLPSGDTLQEAIEKVDDGTRAGPIYYMINCAHPKHFEDALTGNEPWLDRIRGIRANASALSHAELDAATELDDGDPAALGLQYRSLRNSLKRLCVLGGCCGTDHRHIAAICEACSPVATDKASTRLRMKVRRTSSGVHIPTHPIT
ncbi:homocysteine S-methyltransferase family protein [Microvirga guangxiensis]|uniref:Homocysteine S-methyltransferase n=1 Tax=Microvirga guangxiensis TaxID=549386 RepID=A0A1G5HT99_9HYPH|nr:homocysteine S-methyltransferase family protein [Microvirga guangxiensis]SCY67102.1 homocysteine S-methyltransferase [Microvirga guangxiensis]